VLLRLRPDPAPAHAAAGRVEARLGKLGELEAGDRLQGLAGIVEDAVVTAQVAGVVVGDLLRVLAGESQLAVF